MKRLFSGRIKTWKSLDYVAGWFIKARRLSNEDTEQPLRSSPPTRSAKVNKLPILWPLIFKHRTTKFTLRIHRSNGQNLASHNAGVTVVIIGIQITQVRGKLFSVADDGNVVLRKSRTLTPYLVPGTEIYSLSSALTPIGEIARDEQGNMPHDGGASDLSAEEVRTPNLAARTAARFIRRIYGSAEFINGCERVLPLD